MTTINEVAQKVYENARDHGFWDEADDLIDLDPRIKGLIVAQKLMLIDSETAECLEALREDQMQTIFREDGKPEGFNSELADVIIRCFDLAHWLGIDIEHEIMQKHAFNVIRPMKHGKAF